MIHSMMSDPENHHTGSWKATSITASYINTHIDTVQVIGIEIAVWKYKSVQEQGGPGISAS